jgi:tetratricopeptide (TPR) repeat protein
MVAALAPPNCTRFVETVDAETADAAYALLTLAGIAGGLWLASRGVRGLNVHSDYIAGDLAAVESCMTKPERYDVNMRVCMFIALGQYHAAVDAATKALPRLLEHPETEGQVSLVRLNLAEALVELGRLEDALKLLSSSVPMDPLVRTGGLTTHAWILTLQGHHDAALAALTPAIPEHLGAEYAAEPAMMHAWCLLNLGRLDQARTWLDKARTLVVRASSDRNLLLHEARWLVIAGDLAGARMCWNAAREHRGSKQGGIGMRWLADTLAAHGQTEWAREVWARGAQQDPESWAASQALGRLGMHTSEERHGVAGSGQNH